MDPADFQSQISALVAQYGESVLMDRAGHTWTINAFFEHANPTVIGTFFDDNDAVGLVRPVIAMYVDPALSGTSNLPAFNDTFTRDGRTFTVQVAGYYRLGNTVVLVTCVAA